jgi:trans-aconitate methyltransferase
MATSNSDYYGRINTDLLDSIPDHAGLVVETGCGAGALGAEYKRRCPQARYLGIEQNAEAAKLAAGRLDRVIVGNAEQLDAPILAGTVDVLVYGDVLEHLVDPWRLLKRHASWLAPGGIAVACIPNIAHWSVYVELLRGEWPYASEGLFDRTHLRFFTLKSINELFRSAGLRIVETRPRIISSPQLDAKAQEFMRLFRPLATELGLVVEAFAQRSTAIQYVVRATKSE